MAIITAAGLTDLYNQRTFNKNGSTVTLKKISETDWILFGDLAEGDSEGFVGDDDILVVELPPFTIDPQLDDLYVDLSGSFSYDESYQQDGYFDPTEYLTPSQISGVVGDVFNMNQSGLLLQSMHLGMNISYFSPIKPYPPEWYAAFLNVRISVTPPSEFVGVVDKFGVALAPALHVWGGDVSIMLQPLDLELPQSTLDKVWDWMGTTSFRVFDSERMEWVALGEFGLLETEQVSRVRDNPSLFTLLEVS